MITALDTNVLLDILIRGAPHGEESRTALAEAARVGALVISEPVYAELSAYFGEKLSLDRFLDDTSVRLERCTTQALSRAGLSWSEYVRRRPAALPCPQCGRRLTVRCGTCGALFQSRQHVLADFLIGAHALAQADRLLSRDRGFYRTYFSDLDLVPSA